MKFLVFTSRKVFAIKTVRNIMKHPVGDRVCDNLQCERESQLLNYKPV